MKEITILGLGGQGVITVGELIGNIYNKIDKYISLYSFYGSQMRGGEVGITIKIDDDEIVNPVSNVADIFVVLDDSYLDNYKYQINENTKLIHTDNNIKALAKILKELNMNDNKLVEETLKERFKNNEKYEKNIKTFYEAVNEC